MVSERASHASRGLSASLGRVALVACLAVCAANVLGQEPQPVITTIAGGGAPASGNGDGGLATNARLQEPIAVAVDGVGNVYVAERYAFTIRRIDTSGVISTVAGNGGQEFNGDGIPALSAGIDVRGMAVDAVGNIYIADGASGGIRKVSVGGIITTVARAGLSFPTRVAVGPTGTIFVIDGSRVLKVMGDESVQAVAGTGEQGFSGDGGPALQARLSGPSAIAVDGQGNLHIVDGNERVRRVGTNGVITTVAGGGPFRLDPVATSYRWLFPQGIAVDSRGNFYVGGQTSVVRVVNRNGIVADAVGRIVDGGGAVAGGVFGFLGDGGPAVEALLYEPEALAVDRHDNLYVADTRNNRVRKVTRVPTPRTPAGLNAFSAYEAYGVGSYTTHVAIGDVNGDGRKDAILATAGWPYEYADPQRDMRVWVFPQKTDGSLGQPTGYVYAPTDPGGRFGTGLDVADLNGDGFDDVVIGTLTGITVFLGNSNGLSQGITHPSQFQNAQPTLSVTIMDVDRDGRLDVVTLSSGRSEGGSSPDDKTGLVIHYGNGMGGFSRQAFHERPVNVSWTFLRAVDMNRDRIKDLVSGWSDIVNGYYRGGVEVSLHNTVGGFRPATRMQPHEPISWGPTYAIGDFDSDGREDAIVSYVRNAPEAAYARFRQMADGGFKEQGTWQAFDVPEEMISADMNGDGRDDLLVLHAGWSSIGYHEQTAAGLDEEIKYYIVHSSNPKPPTLAVGDLNSDGCKDIAIADRNHGLLVLHGRNCRVSSTFRANGSQPLIPPAAGARPNQFSGTVRAAAGVAGPQTRESDHSGWANARVTAPSSDDPPTRNQRWRVLIVFGLLGFGLAALAVKFTLFRR